MMHLVYRRVANWNFLRYKPIFSSKLTSELLHEEFKEWLEAEDDVAKLDALCDIVFISLGTMWKCQFLLSDIEEAMHHADRVVLNMVNLNELNPAYLIATHLAVFDNERDYPVIMTLSMVISACLAQMLSMGLSNEQTIEALFAVCDSNDTKLVEKTVPNQKYGPGGKGADFVPPTEALTKIIQAKKEFH